MYPLVVDVISGRRAQPTRGGIVVLGSQPLQTYRDLISFRPIQPEEVVVLGQARGRGPWIERGAASQVEATQVVRELNRRNIFGASQRVVTPTPAVQAVELVSPDEALKWGVNFALYHYRPKFTTGWDESKPWLPTIWRTQKEYLSDADFLKKIRRSIAGARYMVGKVKAKQSSPRWGGHRARTNTHEPPVSDILKRAAGML